MPVKKRRPEIKNLHVPKAAIIIVIAALAVIVLTKSEPVQEIPDQMPSIPVPRYHVHADFLVVINGQEIDFSSPKYDFVNPIIHLHVRNFKGGHVMHIESPDATMEDFFQSLGMGISQDCFDTGNERYCTNSTDELSFYVNGNQVESMADYQPQDMDRILIAYGSTDIAREISAVTSLACVFSQKCEAPPEAEGQILYN